MRAQPYQTRMRAKLVQSQTRVQSSPSRGSRWFMIVSLLAMVVVLSLVGLQPHRSPRGGTPATTETTSSTTSTTTNDAGSGSQSTFDGSAVGNN